MAIAACCAFEIDTLFRVDSGRLIAQRYRLEEQLGAGGMGVVWRATDLQLRRSVALKKSQTQDGRQIQDEARKGAGVAHPNVVTVFDSVLDAGERWLVMEFLDALNLAEILHEDGPLPEPLVRRIGEQLADAVAAMHAKGMVHRDIKPSNVLVRADGTAKLTDLGIARWAEVTHTEDSTRLAGTAGYIAPEVADGAAATTAADVFSLGATLFAAVEGHSPWGDSEHGPIAQLRRAATFRLEPTRNAEVLAPILHVLLTHQPADRPSAAAARDLLAGTTTPPTTSATPTRPADPTAPVDPVPRRPTTRSRRWVLAGAAMAIAVAATVVAVMVNEKSTGADATADQPAAAGTLGDPHMADPCSLLDPQSLARFGKVALEPNYGNFNHCDLITVLDDGGTIDVSTDFALPDETPARPPTRGRLGAIERLDRDEDECQRSITLPNLYRVIMIARVAVAPPGQTPDLCGMVDAAALDVQSTLIQGPIPRRPAAFAPKSTARLDACQLLTTAEVAPIVSPDANTNVDVEPEYANWSCYFDGDDRAVHVRFSREWPPDPDEDGAPINLGDRQGFVDESDDGCTVAIVHRTYPVESPPLESPDTRVETVEIKVEGQDDTTDITASCEQATTLATKVVDRLP